MAMRLALLLFALAAAPAACAPGPPSTTPFTADGWRSSGEKVWIEVPGGRLKTRLYRSAKAGPDPVLVVFVHGDIPVPQSFGYVMAHAVAALGTEMAGAGVMRPAYRDPEGDASSGKLGYAIGDNYTPEVVDAIDTAARDLKAKVHARSVILVGHFGGGAIVADLMGRHPATADGAVLIACGCDPIEFQARWVAEHPIFPKHLKNPSLLPLALAPGVSAKAKVRLVIGSRDDVVRLEPSRTYAAALQKRGVDVKLTVVDGAGHNDVVRAQAVYDAIAELVRWKGGALAPRPGPPG
jgi:predicted esterase